MFFRTVSVGAIALLLFIFWLKLKRSEEKAFLSANCSAAQKNPAAWFADVCKVNCQRWVGGKIYNISSSCFFMLSTVCVHFEVFLFSNVPLRLK